MKIWRRWIWRHFEENQLEAWQTGREEEMSVSREAAGAGVRLAAKGTRRCWWKEF